MKFSTKILILGTIFIIAMIIIIVSASLHKGKERSDNVVNEIFTVMEDDQYKFEKIVNKFLNNSWSILKIGYEVFKSDTEKGELWIMWLAILQRESGIGNAKAMEKEALHEYYSQKEER